MVCAAWLVRPPPLPIATAGAVVSSVMVSDAVPVPLTLVSLATSVCEPSVRLGLKLHTPDPFAVTVPRSVPASLIVTTAFASPPPLTAGFVVILSVADTPVSETSASVTFGVKRLTKTLLPPDPSPVTAQLMPV
jgi:hypothetical protein